MCEGPEHHSLFSIPSLLPRNSPTPATRRRDWFQWWMLKGIMFRLIDAQLSERARITTPRENGNHAVRKKAFEKAGISTQPNRWQFSPSLVMALARWTDGVSRAGFSWIAHYQVFFASTFHDVDCRQQMSETYAGDIACQTERSVANSALSSTSTRPALQISPHWHRSGFALDRGVTIPGRPGSLLAAIYYQP